MPCEVAEWHCKFENVLLQHLRPTTNFFIDREKMLVCLLLLLSLLLVLDDETALV